MLAAGSVRFLCTVGGLGRSPVSPGSLGALPAIPVAWLLRDAHWGLWFGLCCALFAVSVPLANAYLGQGEKVMIHARTQDPHDPQEVVLDEFLGCFVALAFVPWSWMWAGMAYGLFRLLDIWKPGPIGWVDRHAPLGLGIMGDDLVAGLIAGLVLYSAVGLL